MRQLPVKTNSAWSEATIAAYLKKTSDPMRLACQDVGGYPLICSLWFSYQNGSLWSVSHRNAYIVKLLKQDNRCGFEISVNSPPYMGVRGKGRATLSMENGKDILAQLIDAAPISTDSRLARWLLSRADDEYAIRIDIERITAWDYSARM